MTPKRMLQAMIVAVIAAAVVPSPVAASDVPESLDYGFRLMYGLDFTSAEKVFGQWRAEHPDDPLAPMSQAAILLFSELNRSGILQAQFFVDDASFTTNKPSAPPPGLRARFDAAADEAEAVARARLSEDPRNRDALFALSMVFGLRADYAALVEGRNMAALSYTRQATEVAHTLLAIDPDYADAYLATGISQYLIGSLFAPLRWVLRLAGFQGDKTKGIRELQLTMDHGRFLGPFARILLTIAYLRQHDTERARQLLAGLEREFPTNPLFGRELQRIGPKVP